MKKLSLILAIIALCSCSAFAVINHLSFKDGRFKIAQFTDLHIAPQKSNTIETLDILTNVIKSECPDLVVITGDVITAEPAKEGWDAFLHTMNSARVPFIVTLGNHDAEYLTKNQIYDMLQTSQYYVGDKGPSDIFGCGNCALPIYGNDNKVEALVYCIDSNDYQPNKKLGHYDWIHFDQLQWYRNISKKYTAKNDGKVLPAVAFFHIPLQEYGEITNDGKTFGNANEGVASAKINSGAFSSFLDMKDVMGIFVGHDHDNDHIGINKEVAMAYGRVSGVEAYGNLVRGARIISLYENQRKFDSWITTPQGREATYYYPSGLNSKAEENSTYEPACVFTKKELKTLVNGVTYKYYTGKCKKIADIAKCEMVKSGIMNDITIKNATEKDHFAYEFTAYVKIPEKGIYRFYSYSDDGSIVYIDDKEVVNNDGGHSARRAEGQIALEAGYHKIKVLYFEDYMGEELEIGIVSRNIAEMPIPTNMLFTPKK